MTDRLVFEQAQLEYGHGNSSRFDRRPLPHPPLATKDWIFSDDAEDASTLMQRLKLRKKRVISFRDAARKIQVSKRVGIGIMGRLKGRLLQNADLPMGLRRELQQQFEWSMPADHDDDGQSDDSSDDEDALEKPVVAEDTEADEEESDEEREEALSAFRDFRFRAEAVKEAETEDVTTGLAAGLKSWLTFGSSLASASGGAGAVSASAAHGEMENRLTAFLTKTQPFVDKVKAKDSKGLVCLRSTDDTLTKSAEEQAIKIAGEFCAWLRDLPKGDDDTVNTIPEEHIRALFDAGQTVNPAKSKLVEGLKSWVKFGAQVTGRREDIVSIAKQQVNKNRFKKQIQQRKKSQRKKRPSWNKGGRRDTKKGSLLERDEDRAAFSPHQRVHRRKLYASDVWYIKPSRWGEKFEQVTHEKEFTSTVEAVLASTIPASERPLISSIERTGVGEILSSGSNSQDGLALLKAKDMESNRVGLRRPRVGSATTSGGSSRPATSDRHQQALARQQQAQRAAELASLREAENRKISQLESTLAFAKFLATRPNYKPPDFLQQVLSPEETTVKP